MGCKTLGNLLDKGKLKVTQFKRLDSTKCFINFKDQELTELNGPNFIFLKTLLRTVLSSNCSAQTLHHLHVPISLMIYLFSGSFSGERKTLAKAISSMDMVLLIKEQLFRSTPVSIALQNDKLKIIIMPKRHIMRSIFWFYIEFGKLCPKSLLELNDHSIHLTVWASWSMGSSNTRIPSVSSFLHLEKEGMGLLARWQGRHMFGFLAHGR